MTVGERIKKVRTSLGLSQVDFADKLNVSKQTLYKYENNIITNIPSDKIEAAARLGNVSPAYLMGWEQIDSYYSGKEASPHIYHKFTRNIEKIHKKQVELVNIYDQLSDNNQGKVLQYSKNLLSNQQMEKEAELLAAHARTTIEATEDGLKQDLDIMNNDDMWK